MIYAADNEITSGVWGGPGGRDLYGGGELDRPWPTRRMTRSKAAYQARRLKRALIDLMDEAAYYAEARHYAM